MIAWFISALLVIVTIVALFVMSPFFGAAAILFLLLIISLLKRNSGLLVDLVAFVGLPESGEVSENVRVVIERFGSFHEIRGSGAFWYPPIGYQVVRDITIADDHIDLYGDEKHPATKDLPDGSVTAVGAEVVFRVLEPDTPYYVLENRNTEGKIYEIDPTGAMVGFDGVAARTGTYRAAYQSTDYRRDLENIADTALSGFITSIGSVDDLLNLPTFEFWESELISDIIDEDGTIRRDGRPATQPLRMRAERAAARLGVQILRIQVEHFQQSDEAIQARESVNRSKREAASAKYVAEKSATENIWPIIEMMAYASGRTTEDIQNEVRESPELRVWMREFASDVIARPPSERNLQDIYIRGGGSGDLSTVVAGLMSYLGGNQEE